MDTGNNVESLLALKASRPEYIESGTTTTQPPATRTPTNNNNKTTVTTPTTNLFMYLFIESL